MTKDLRLRGGALDDDGKSLFDPPRGTECADDVATALCSPTGRSTTEGTAMTRWTQQLVRSGSTWTFAACLMLGLGLLLSPPTRANTPDDETPAVEDVCAGEVGPAYGLCNAYCEAMDCHLGDDAQASETACDKILQKYIDHTGLMPPCESEPLEVCDDGIDNDIDGFTDCKDDKCGSDPACPCGVNPAGCTRTSCAPGLRCIVTQECRSTACFCTEIGYVCTADCSGGSCVDPGI